MHGCILDRNELLEISTIDELNVLLNLSIPEGIFQSRSGLSVTLEGKIVKPVRQTVVKNQNGWFAQDLCTVDWITHNTMTVCAWHLANDVNENVMVRLFDNLDNPRIKEVLRYPTKTDRRYFCRFGLCLMCVIPGKGEITELDKAMRTL